MGNRNTTGKKTICNHCKYEWFTNSTHYKTSCPRCGWRVKLKDVDHALYPDTLEYPTTNNNIRHINNTNLKFKIFLRDNFTCQYCGRTIKNGIHLNVDHIIPISQGGKFIEDNLITSCNICNQLKSDINLSDDDIKKIKQIEKPIKTINEILEII